MLFNRRYAAGTCHALYSQETLIEVVVLDHIRGLERRFRFRGCSRDLRRARGVDAVVRLVDEALYLVGLPQVPVKHHVHVVLLGVDKNTEDPIS